MAQADLERLLVATSALDEVFRPLATLMSDTIQTDSLRIGLTATPAHGELVSAAAAGAREIADILRPTADSGASRDVTRAVNLLDGISWDRLDDLFSVATPTDPGDILRYSFVKHAEVMTLFVENAVQKAARQAAADLRHAAG